MALKRINKVSVDVFVSAFLANGELKVNVNSHGYGVPFRSCMKIVWAIHIGC